MDNWIEKDIFPGVMLPPFYYACFTRFHGFSEDRTYTVHASFQIILGLKGTLHFELEDKTIIHHTAGHIFVLSPGIRHRWFTDPDGFCENFMFFCNGFNDDESGLGQIMNLTQTNLIWNFPLAKSISSTYIQRFREIIGGNGSCHPNLMHGLLYAFTAEVCSLACQKKIYLPHQDQHPALRLALQYIQRNYRQPITLTELALECNLGTSRLSELFRGAFGLSPLQYISWLKTQKAKQLLEHSDMNVSEVAEYLGFESIHYFSRFYKKQTGVCPTQTPPAEP